VNKYLKWLLAASLSIILLYLTAGFYLSSYLVADDELAAADAIVILVGSSLIRVTEASDLFSNGYADQIILVQDYGEHNEAEEAWLYAQKLGVPADRITVLPGPAKSTWDEAKAVRDYLAERPEIRTLILVTSREHTRRARIAFQRMLSCLERDVLLISRASRYVAIGEKAVYRDLDAGQRLPDYLSVRAMATESIKLCYYYILSFYMQCSDSE
jgi:hypothetical protein